MGKLRKTRAAIVKRITSSSFWDLSDTAAAQVDMTPHMLRQRLRRSPSRVIRGIRVHRCGPIIGVKLGNLWLVHVITPESLVRSGA